MTATLQPDLCVIGASEAGRAVAMGAVAMGCAVVVIDHGDPSGLSNRDLVLELLRAGARASDADPATAWARLQAGLDRAAAERSHARLAAMNIRVIAATGRFHDPETVEADGTAVRARRFVIATGRAQPDEPGALLHRLDALAALPSMPAAVRILGGGAEMLSAAQSLGRLGAVVTLQTDAVLPGIDGELAAPLLARLRRDGVTRLGDDAMVSDPALRFAEAARPALDALALDLAGVARRGESLKLMPALRTTNPRIYSVGCPGGAASTAAGLPQAGVVLRSALLRLPARARSDRVPVLVLTDPEIAQVGLTEAAARDKGAVSVWRWPLGQTGPGLAAGAVLGHVKIVTDRHGRILGAGIVGPQARDLIGFWVLALARNLSLADLADVPVPMPSWSETARGIAVSHAARRLSNPWVRRALDLVRRLG